MVTKRAFSGDRCALSEKFLEEPSTTKMKISRSLPLARVAWILIIVLAPVGVVAGGSVPAPSPSTRSIGTSEASPVFVKSVTPWTDPAILAACALVGATILALLVGEWQRRVSEHNTREAVRRQRDYERGVRGEEAVELQHQRVEEAAVSDDAAIAQLVVMMQSYERYMAMLRAMPNHPVQGQIAAARTFFTRAFENDISRAIHPPDRRAVVYRSILKAHETLTVSSVQQEIYDEMVTKLNLEQDLAHTYTLRHDRLYRELVALAGKLQHEYDPARRADLQARHSEVMGDLEDLESSVDAVSAANFEATKDQRAEKAGAIYPLIVANASDAKDELARARALLGDTFVIQDFKPEVQQG